MSTVTIDLGPPHGSIEAEYVAEAVKVSGRPGVCHVYAARVRNTMRRGRGPDQAQALAAFIREMRWALEGGGAGPAPRYRGNRTGD